MYLIWILVVPSAVFLLYIVTVIVRGRKPLSTPRVMPLPRLPCELRADLGAQGGKSRKIKLVSAREFDAIATGSRDTIFIDMRPSGDPAPLPGVPTLSLEPGELFEVLQWIPPETSIVLRGVSDLSKAIIWSGHNIAGVAPVYIVTSDLFHWEVA